MLRLLRQACWALVIAFPLLVLAGQRWQHAAAGPGTHSVMALAAVICPAAVEPVRAVRVADGALALDRAVLRRITAQLHIGPRCSVPVEPPSAHADRRRDHGGGEKMRGMGKSM
ncbi:hypothetical protein [Sphingomonas sp. SORGH_AS_0802]|nr:hypothetical protein [Sphingomonas sp. SORGH_AS_0802]